MNRLKKELIKRGIVFDHCDDPYEECRSLVAIEGDIIITLWGCTVMDDEFHLFDKRTFEKIGSQDRYKSEFLFRKGSTWNSVGCV